jgi:hypothetical protein
MERDSTDAIGDQIGEEVSVSATTDLRIGAPCLQ